MIATAHAGDWEGRIEELRTRVDKKDDRGQYCARHAAMLRKANEKKGKNELTTSTPKVSKPCTTIFRS
jgi:hypothetical protein